MKKKKAAATQIEINRFRIHIENCICSNEIHRCLCCIRIMQLLVKIETQASQTSFATFYFICCDTMLNGLRIKKKIQQAKRKQVDFELRPQRRYTLNGNLCIEGAAAKRHTLHVHCTRHAAPRHHQVA